MELPHGWVNCPPVGQVIQDLILPFKTIVDERFNDQVPLNKRFGINKLNKLIQTENLRLIIDLTPTNIYYEKSRIKKAVYTKLLEDGYTGFPTELHLTRFGKLAKNLINEDLSAKIGVHCTDGFNTTGFVIVSFLVKFLNMKLEHAFKVFTQARPPGIYDPTYIEELKNLYDIDARIEIPATPSWMMQGETKKPCARKKPSGARSATPCDDVVPKVAKRPRKPATKAIKLKAPKSAEFVEDSTPSQTEEISALCPLVETKELEDIPNIPECQLQDETTSCASIIDESSLMESEVAGKRQLPADSIIKRTPFRRNCAKANYNVPPTILKERPPQPASRDSLGSSVSQLSDNDRPRTKASVSSMQPNFPKPSSISQNRDDVKIISEIINQQLGSPSKISPQETQEKYRGSIASVSSLSSISDHDTCEIDVPVSPLPLLHQSAEDLKSVAIEVDKFLQSFETDTEMANVQKHDQEMELRKESSLSKKSPLSKLKVRKWLPPNCKLAANRRKSMDNQAMSPSSDQPLCAISPEVAVKRRSRSLDRKGHKGYEKNDGRGQRDDRKYYERYDKKDYTRDDRKDDQRNGRRPDWRDDRKDDRRDYRRDDRRDYRKDDGRDYRKDDRRNYPKDDRKDYRKDDLKDYQKDDRWNYRKDDRRDYQKDERRDYRRDDRTEKHGRRENYKSTAEGASLKPRKRDFSVGDRTNTADKRCRHDADDRKPYHASSGECHRESSINAPKFIVQSDLIVPLTSSRAIESIRSEAKKLLKTDISDFWGIRLKPLLMSNYDEFQNGEYYHTWSTDGKKYILIILSETESYFIDEQNHVFQISSLKMPHFSNPNKYLKNTILEGEFVVDKSEKGEQNMFLISNALIIDGNQVSDKDLLKRLSITESLILVPRKNIAPCDISSQPFNIGMKRFLKKQFLNHVWTKLRLNVPHTMTGLEFYPNFSDIYVMPSIEEVAYYWKPIEFRHIDFKLKTEVNDQNEMRGDIYAKGDKKPIAEIQGVPMTELMKLDNLIVKCRYNPVTKAWTYVDISDSKYFIEINDLNVIMRDFENPVTFDQLIVMS